LSSDDLEKVRGTNDRLDMNEVEEVYLPLSRLLNLHITATQQLSAVTDTFLSTEPAAVPYIIGIGGSVAVGKSTTARVLQALLSHWPTHPSVDLITTDGFLLPNAELARRGLMSRKGFPESYDTAALIDVLREMKSGTPTVSAPVYSHLSYDILPDEQIVLRQPDVLIVEGLNVLQGNGSSQNQFVSDFFDFSVYVDADESEIKSWYIERFLTLRESVFQNPESYFRNYADLDREEAIGVAAAIWDEINAPNLAENIAPTKNRARCILTKGVNHQVERIQIQKT
ncbi:MAG: type I pantothenate kinase, partial [Acidimicrobiia bacterium]